MTESEAIEIVRKEKSYMDSHAGRAQSESFQMAINALEKQMPKKPVKSEKQVVRYVNTYYCPICNLGITGTNIAKWCYHCGQKMDWS